MEQKSDVKYRAEKLYKNSREKFAYLLREVVSNALHATIIRDMSNDNALYKPKVEVAITQSKKSIKIVVKDNGEGFNGLNRKYFTHLDTKNPQKEELHFHPMGQGRLAIVYFTDNASYKSVFIEEDGKYWQKIFNYPEESTPLFDIEDFKGQKSDKSDSETTLTLEIDKQQTYKRANTFLKKYPDIEKLKHWFIENFFPFFMENESLILSVEIDDNYSEISKSYIENNIDSIPFNVIFKDEPETPHDFKLWLVKKDGVPKTKIQITCFARHLRAEIENSKLEYDIDLPDAYDWFLTAAYFDDNVDQKGDKIEIPGKHVEIIQLNLSKALDKHFASQIKKNRAETRNNILNTEKNFPSLSLFMENNAHSTRRILTESDLVSGAIDNKGKAEKKYWLSKKTDTEEAEKLLNSSLHIYIDHRKRVLEKLKELINKFDDEGEVKNDLEKDIHDLFLKQGENLRTTKNTNHLHNLWILDDKYTIFSETFGSQSTRNGQKASDIYLWADDPSRPRELLILELKSPTKAHNAGNKYESMVAQVKRYASDFYKDPEKLLNWSVNPTGILYFGIILARKKDVYKEIASNNVGGNHTKIPFLEASYFFNDKFTIDSNNSSAPQFMDIRIEMYAYEDIFQLSSNRNDVFFGLLKKEFSIELEDNKENLPEEESCDLD